MALYVYPESKVIINEGIDITFPDTIQLLPEHEGLHALAWRDNSGIIEWESSLNKEPSILGPDEYESQVKYYIDMYSKEKAIQDEDKQVSYNSNAKRLERLRMTRDEKLMDTDYLLMPDYPITEECRAAFQAYRQALRDMTNNPESPWDGDNIPWPSMPEIVKISE